MERASRLGDISHLDLWLDLSEGKTTHMGCGGLVNLHTSGDKKKYLKCGACGMEVYTTILVTFMGSSHTAH